MPDGFWQAAGDWALLVATPAPLLFLGFYAARSRFWATLAGRSIFTLAVSLSALVALVFWAAFDRVFKTDSDAVRVVFRFGAYSLVAVACWLQFIALLRYQRAAAREPQKPAEDLRP